MKLERVELSELSVELPRPARGARLAWSHRRVVRLRIWADGVVGEGEAAPLPDYSPDRLEDAREALRTWAAAARGATLDVPDAESLVAELGALPSSLPSARFALETALLDLRSRLEGAPVHALLGGAASEEPGVCALLGADAPVEDAEAALARGASALKLKVAGAQSWSVAATLRERFAGTPLRLDFNGGLAPEDATPALARAAELGVELVEEPARAGWEARPPLPVYLDESLAQAGVRARAAERVAAHEVHGVVLKPMLLGGSLACLKLAGEVRGAGGDAFVTHLFDSPLALAACAELSLALGGTRAHGLGPHSALALDPSFRAHAHEGYRLRPHDRPGLGIGGAT